MDTSNNSQNTHPSEEIPELINHLIAAGALGRSPIYANLLNYFYENCSNGKTCSEHSIAVDVFEKGNDYDITTDSTVRVYIYNLRKKLDKYYSGDGKNNLQKLYIPKGEYRLSIDNKDIDSDNQPLDTQVGESYLSPENYKNTASDQPNQQSKPFNYFKYALLTLIAMAITAIVTSELVKEFAQPRKLEAEFSQQQLYFWEGLLTDNKPIMVVIGDYYIFAESSVNENDLRLVREFDINSADDLRRNNSNQFKSDPTTKTQRTDLGLTYLPRGSAYALANVQQLLSKANKVPRISMMSELSAEDIRSNHIIYIGYLSGLGVLEGYVFADSRFEIGDTYDELIDTKTMTRYRSDFIDAKQDGNFTDFGTISSFTLAAKNKIIALKGTRDAGLMEMSDIALADDILDQMGLDTSANKLYESLFEVSGFNLTNISSELIVSDAIPNGE